MSSYSEFHVEFNGYSPINRNDPQKVEIFGPASLKKDVNKSLAEFTSVFAQSAYQLLEFYSPRVSKSQKKKPRAFKQNTQ